ncbi:MAG: Mu transposase C-terminal domain-containing protein [Phycisphaerae bacterium]|jgi:hypothetical protein
MSAGLRLAPGEYVTEDGEVIQRQPRAGLGAGRVPFELCRGAWPCTDVGRQQRRRFWMGLSETLREEGPDGEKYIDASVTLPGGDKAGKFVQLEWGYKPPAGWRTWTAQQRRDWERKVAVLVRVEQFFLARPHLLRSKPSSYREFNRANVEWLAEMGREYQPCGRPLRVSKTTLNAYARTINDPDKAAPKRGRPKGSGAKEWHPRALELFDTLYRGHRDASDVLRKIQAYAWKEGFEAPTPAMVYKRIREMTQAERVFRRSGMRGVKEQCVPKMRRTRAELKGWSFGDGHTIAGFIRVPDGHGGLKAVRPTVAGVYVAFAQKFSEARAGLSESAELMAAAWRGAVLEDGPPAVAQFDNTHAMDGLTGSPYRKQPGRRAKYASGGLGGFFSLFGTQVHKSKPGEKHTNAVESGWRYLIRAVEKWMNSYCGSHPKDKPEGLDRWLRDNIDKLPTLEDLNVFLREFKAAHNATPRRALGGLTPNLFMERYGPTRRIIDPDTIDIYLCPIVAERTLGRDGVSLNDILYTPGPSVLLRWQGKRVGVRRDPDRLDRVTLCDADGVAIGRAYNDKLRGARAQSMKVAERRARQYKAALRTMIDTRDTRFMPKTFEILRVEREYREAEEGRLRKQLADDPKRETTIIRPDLAASAAECKEADARRDAQHERQKARKAVGDAAERAGYSQDELLSGLGRSAMLTGGMSDELRARIRRSINMMDDCDNECEARAEAQEPGDRRRMVMEQLAARARYDEEAERNTPRRESIGERFAKMYREAEGGGQGGPGGDMSGFDMLARGPAADADDDDELDPVALRMEYFGSEIPRPPSEEPNPWDEFVVGEDEDGDAEQGDDDAA